MLRRTGICLLLITLCSKPHILLASGHRQPLGNREKAVIAYYKGDYSTAVLEYERLWLRDKENQALARDLAAAYCAAGNYTKARRVLEHARVSGLELGEVKLAEGDFSGAVDELEKNLKGQGDHTRARILLGLIAYHQGRYAAATEHLWQARNNSPARGSIHLFLGRAFHRLAESAATQKKYFVKRANEEFSKTVQVDPSLWQVHRDLAQFETEEGHWEQALRHWRKVKSVIGNANEVKNAMEMLKTRIPTPTVTPTPEVVFKAAVPQQPKLEDIVLTPLESKGQTTQIRVGLGNHLHHMAFACLGEWHAINIYGKTFWQGKAKTGYRIERHPDGGWVLSSWEGQKLKRFRKTMILEPVNAKYPMIVLDLYQSAGYLWSVGKKKSRYYRGVLEIYPRKKTLRLVNQLSLEAYLLSVVPGEMPALWPLEGLKAQAVVARTDTLLRRRNHRRQGYDVCNQVHCAMYRGVTSEHPRTHLAVTETAGIVIQKGKKLLPTFYSHSCGGMTQGYKEAWWKKVNNPKKPEGVYDMIGNSQTVKMLPLAPGQIDRWLAQNVDVFCNDPEYSATRNFRWMKVLTREELTDVLDRRYGIGTVQHIRIIERSPSAYVKRIRVIGTRGKKVIYGDYIRSAMGGLRSNLFSILPIPDNSEQHKGTHAWLIWGGGWGHGVGLCQVGAGSMGRKGYTYQQIIKHYFPEGELKPWPPVD